MLAILTNAVLLLTFLAGVGVLTGLAVNGPPLDVDRLKTYRLAAIIVGVFSLAVAAERWWHDNPSMVAFSLANALVAVALVYSSYALAWRADQEDADFALADVPDTERVD